MTTGSSNQKFKILVSLAGAAIFAVCVLRQAQTGFELRYLWIALITLLFGSRISIKIPQTDGQISVSDTFIFLAIILFGREAAVLLAAADGFVSSFRFTRRKLTIVFNSMVMALSTFVAASAYQFSLSFSDETTGYSAGFMVGLCVVACLQYVINSGLIAGGVSIAHGESLWLTWKKHFLWSSITYFAGAFAAGIISRLIETAGFYAVVATLPIIAGVYFTYKTYLKNVESAEAHARQAERHMIELKESEERFRSTFDHAAGMALVASDGQWIRVNRALSEMVGYAEEEFLRTTVQAISAPDDLGRLVYETEQLLNGNRNAFQREQRFLHKNGDVVWVLLSVTAIHNTSADRRELIFQVQNITDRKLAEERLVHEAFHDGLTGLPNRALFMDHLRMAVERAKRRPDRMFAVLFLDADRFKIINDSLGHPVGDQLLVGMAERIKNCARPSDTVARLGGDEFTVLLEDLRNPNEAIEVAERMQKAISSPFDLNGHRVVTTVSIGIAPSSMGYEDPQDVLRDADTAMYHAKMLGKARHEVFDKALHARALNLLKLEADLRRALDNGELCLFYQPIVSLKTGKIAGFEALIRWPHPERGLIPPIEFIPIAEETGLIDPIGRWILSEAPRQLRQWQLEFPQYADLQLSVNISSKQFAQQTLIEQVSRVIYETGLDPRTLKLEITEGLMMDNVEHAVDTLQQLRALGVEISIDDFGTGYSSLSYLHRFPISTLKVDRSFVTQMSDNAENAEIVKTIISLAKNLRMTVVAEGVETEVQLYRLMDLRCDYGQGFYFSKPLTVADTRRLLSGTDPYRLPPSRLEMVLNFENNPAS